VADKDLSKTTKFEHTADLSKTTKFQTKVDLSKTIKFENIFHLLFPKKLT
jgi:hypothetical protein